MDTVSVNLSFPKGMLPYLMEEEPEEGFARNAMILYPYIQNQQISHGRAAEILGVRKWDLIEFYSMMGVPYLDQSREELLSELAVYDRLKKRQIS